MSKFISSTIWLTLLLCSPTLLRAQGIPDYICVEVNADGTVTYTLGPSNSGEEYTLYFVGDNDNEFFVESYTGLTQHTGIDVIENTAEPQPYHYKVISASGEESEVISTILLELTPQSFSTEALLEWNAPYENMPDEGYYEILRSVGGAGYNSIAQLPTSALSYVDVIQGICDPTTIKYQVGWVRPGKCSMFSQEESDDDFVDGTFPPVPLIETITIDTITGNTVIHWYDSPAPDMLEYWMTYVDGNFQSVIDTVPFGEGTTYIYDQGSTVSSNTMAVIAVDSCGGEQNFLVAAETMFLESSFENCDEYITLTWNPYLYWPAGVMDYTVVIEIDGNYTFSEPIDPLTPSYLIPASADLEGASIYVRANPLDDSVISTSNVITLDDISIENQPDEFYVSNVSTLNDNAIEVELRRDMNATNAQYRLLKSYSGRPYEIVGEYPQPAGEYMTVVDPSVSADVLLYNYKWHAIDACGRLVDEERNEAQNIVLNTASFPNDTINQFVWNTYTGWDSLGGLEEYIIYRKIGKDGVFEEIDQVGPEVTYYADDVGEYRFEEGLFCYKVVAIEGSNDFGKTAESASNEICMVQDPIIWIHNALVVNDPNERRRIFRPELSFIDFDSYEMQIKNKWNEELFYTQDAREGWDGSYKGNNVKEDYYIYIISYRDGSGQYYLKRGEVYVLHDYKQ